MDASHIQERIGHIAESFWRLSNATGLAVGVICDLPPARATTWRYFFGSTHDGGPKPQPRTIFQIGSITKTFTAAILAEACDQETVQLQDDAQTWAPPAIGLPTHDTWNTSTSILDVLQQSR